MSKGIHVDASALAYARTTWTAQLNGAISAQVQQATSLGGTAGCQKADGSAFTGVELVTALPPAIRQVELANQAIDLVLSSHGTDISDAAVIKYYAANPTQFTKDCVSVIQTADQATATTAYDSLKAGTPFAQVAASATADPAAAAKSGQAGCFTEAAVLSQLQLPSVAVGQAITPFQSNGNWLVYVVTSRTPVPIADVTGDIRLALLQMPASQQRVANEVLTFARGSSVDINPQYGTWTGITIVPPVPPAPKLPAAELRVDDHPLASDHHLSDHQPLRPPRPRPPRPAGRAERPVPGAPRIDVVGLGPAGPELITAGTLALLASADQVFLRTGRHPAADAVRPGPPPSTTTTSRPTPSTTSTGPSSTTS